jgi:hypothetical protein
MKIKSIEGCKYYVSFIDDHCCNPTLGLNVRMKLTLPKVGMWSPPGLPKIQSSIAGAKTPRIGVFFVSIERS